MKPLRDKKGRIMKGSVSCYPLKPFHNRAWLEKEYSLKKREATDIGKQFDMNKDSIWYWIRKFNIPRHDSTKKEKICARCQNKFSFFRHNQKFCSFNCMKNIKRGTKNCICGKQAIYKYCSKKCCIKATNKLSYPKQQKRIWGLKLSIIKKLGGKCIKCDENDIRVLDINHINRNLKQKPPGKQWTMYFRVREWAKNIKNLEILCANCHRRHTWKQMNYGKYLLN